MGKLTTILGLTAGMVGGLATYHVALKLGEYTLLSPQSLERYKSTIAALEMENRELNDELFLARGQLTALPGTRGLPYDGEQDASIAVAAARAAAVRDNKFLMVTFGANWCQDCRSLHRMIHSEEVENYTRNLFRFVNVDVGKFNQNRSVADDLGINLSHGIPVAIFFDPHGEVIGTTNDGQLEPARRYTSKQILKFLRDIAERSRVAAPDSVD